MARSGSTDLSIPVLPPSERGFGTGSNTSQGSDPLAPRQRSPSLGMTSHVPASTNDCKVYVRNLRARTTPEELRQFFSNFGTVHSIRMHREKAGTTYCAYVTFLIQDSAAIAIRQANGSPYFQQQDESDPIPPLSVRIAESLTERSERRVRRSSAPVGMPQSALPGELVQVGPPFNLQPPEQQLQVLLGTPPWSPQPLPPSPPPVQAQAQWMPQLAQQPQPGVNQSGQSIQYVMLPNGQIQPVVMAGPQMHQQQQPMMFQGQLPPQHVMGLHGQGLAQPQPQMIHLQQQQQPQPQPMQPSHLQPQPQQQLFFMQPFNPNQGHR